MNISLELFLININTRKEQGYRICLTEYGLRTWSILMIQLIVNAFVEKEKTGAVVEVLYASSDHEKMKAKYEELVAQYPENYLAIYDLPLDTDLNTLNHYPSVWIGKEEFE